MEFIYGKNTITLEKELSPLDEFTMAFTEVLEKNEISYVLISGYIAILFGRSRSSEDIDMFIEKIPYEKFKTLWSDLNKEFECLATNNPKEAYETYLLENFAIRFSIKGNYLPNMELKFPKDEIDERTLNEKLTVILNGDKMFISTIEQQIAFKLYLSSEKDIEDARHLHRIFKEHLNLKEMKEWVQKLDILKQYRRYLDDNFN